MSRNELGLRELYTILGQRLEQLSLPELQRAVLAHAADVPAEERRNFLDHFLSPGQVPEEQLAALELPPILRDLTWPVDSDPLLDEIDAFADRVEAGHFFEGFGWDDDIHDERSFGDESWTDEMADYFHAAHEEFTTGNLGLARAAYRKLFDALDLDGDVGTFSGQEPAVVMLDVNLHEAMSQYLRAVYETSAPEERTGKLVEAWARLPLPAEEPSLLDIRDCAPEDLPNFDAFLPLWLEQLSETDRGQQLVRRLLLEAATFSGNLASLDEVARRPGPGQGSLYLEWIRSLRIVSDTALAADAAREALATPEIGSYNRAAIAEELAELSEPDPGAVLNARRLAWRSRPSETRLLLLHHAVAQLGDPALVMAEELAYAESGEQSELLGRSLFSCLLLLSGELERATELLSLPPDERKREVSGSVLVPYLLVSASRALDGEQDAIIWASSYLNTLNGRTMRLGEPGKEEIPTLAELFASRICAETAEPATLESRLEVALGQLGHEVDAIVSNKRQSEYQKAAEWLAHGARALSLARGGDSGAVWFRNWSTRYPRHVAFRRELERAWPDAASTS
jgi:hypothetical protein